ncbi:MAG TPA: hypothetical protein VGD22_00960 [Sphingobacteriaceae bacterium]
MRSILIVGDFSSAGSFLTYGFEKRGIKVTHIAYQNGWRENPIQNNLTSNYKGIIGKIHNYIKPFTLNHLKGHDAVIFLDYFPFPRTFGINSRFTKLIQESNKFSYLWVMGCDSRMREWGKVKNFDLCNSCLIYDQKSLVCICEKDRAAEETFLEGIDAIVPACFEYHEAHKGNPKTGNIIQLPVLLPLSQPISDTSVKKDKINIFHGLNRYGFKGTHIVQRVFGDLNEEYSKRVNFLINGKLTFNNYNKLLDLQDIVVDQIFNQSMGINALLTLAKGKILVSGDPSPACGALNIPLPPMVTIEPSIKGLKRGIEYVIDNYDKLKVLKDEGREYVRKFHAPEVIAGKFIEVFGW